MLFQAALSGIADAVTWLAASLRPGAGETIAIQRQRAEAQLDQLSVASSNPSLRIEPGTLQVIRSRAEFTGSGKYLTSYTLTRFCRNPAGEYFMLVSTSGTPFVKHLARDRAKLVLGDRYVAPDASAGE